MISAAYIRNEPIAMGLDVTSASRGSARVRNGERSLFVPFHTEPPRQAGRGSHRGCCRLEALCPGVYGTERDPPLGSPVSLPLPGRGSAGAVPGAARRLPLLLPTAVPEGRRMARRMPRARRGSRAGGASPASAAAPASPRLSALNASAAAATKAGGGCE